MSEDKKQNGAFEPDPTGTASGRVSRKVFIEFCTSSSEQMAQVMSVLAHVSNNQGVSPEIVIGQVVVQWALDQIENGLKYSEGDRWVERVMKYVEDQRKESDEREARKLYKYLLSLPGYEAYEAWSQTSSRYPDADFGNAPDYKTSNPTQYKEMEDIGKPEHKSFTMYFTESDDDEAWPKDIYLYHCNRVGILPSEDKAQYKSDSQAFRRALDGCFINERRKWRPTGAIKKIIESAKSEEDIADQLDDVLPGKKEEVESGLES